jgi:type IV fimbrial biogenesis protein FimT
MSRIILNPERGMTLIEVMIALTIAIVALALAVPSYSGWVQNTQLRTAGESAMMGIQLARAEALKRNSTALFQLTTTSGADCALSTAGTNWVVSLDDATGLCNVTDPSVTPFIIRSMASIEGTKNTTFLASVSSIKFNGLGQVTPTPASTITIDFGNTVGGTCVSAGGTMRCLEIQVSAAGQVRMCDPAVTSGSDPRKC